MARDLAPDVERLLERQPNPYIRKKAALCAIRWALYCSVLQQFAVAL
jgi:hypothetical protein